MKQKRIETRHTRVKLANEIPLPAPFTLRIDPCGACNFKCVFCPCNHSDFQAKERHQRMSWDTFIRALDGMKAWAELDAQERPGQELSLKVVDFHGFGEPLLNPLLPDMIRAVKEAQVCREIRLVTNGSLLTPEMSKTLIEAGVNLCRVSVEALEAEDYRQLCGVNFDPEILTHYIKEYFNQSRGKKSRISAKIVSTALRTEADVQRFHRIYDPITDFAFIEDIVEAWPDFDAQIKSAKPHIHVTETANRKQNETSAQQQIICTMPFTDMQIHADGLVSPCCLDWKRELVYGDLSKTGLAELWRDTLKTLWKKHLDRSAYRNTICRTCICRLSMPDNIDDDAERILSRIDRKERNQKKIKSLFATEGK